MTGSNIVQTGTRSLDSLVMDIPGILCKHGCSYMACRGLVLTPLSGLFILSHGPAGCSYYSWGGNRLRHQASESGRDFYRYSFSTRMVESDIIFGGEKKLFQAIREAVELFNPPVIAICSTCPIGLIGDDVKKVAEAALQEFGVKILCFSCEGFRSIPGYRLANQGLIDEVIGTGSQVPGPYPVNIIGEFFNGPRAGEISRMLDYVGYDIIGVLMGDGSYESLQNAHQARLNLFGSDKAVADLGDLLQQRLGIEWMAFNFIGTSNIINSLRNMAAFFGSARLAERTEELIELELSRVRESMEAFRARLTGKIAVLFEDEFVSRHYEALLKELEIETVLIGQELLCQTGENELKFMSTAFSQGSCQVNPKQVQAESSPAAPPSGMRFEMDLEHYYVHLPAAPGSRIESWASATSFDAGGSDTAAANTDHNNSASKMPSAPASAPASAPVPPRATVPRHGGLARLEELTGPGKLTRLSGLDAQAVEKLLNTIRPDIVLPGVRDRFPGIGGTYQPCYFQADDYRFDYGGFGGAADLARDLLMSLKMAGWLVNRAPWDSPPEAGMLSALQKGGLPHD